jgi:hypothetical protein
MKSRSEKCYNSKFYCMQMMLMTTLLNLYELISFGDAHGKKEWAKAMQG